MSKNRKFLPPGAEHIDEAIVLLHNLDPKDRNGVTFDFVVGIERWLRESIRVNRITLTDSLASIDEGLQSAVLIVSYDWLYSGNRWRGGFKEVRQLAREARKKKLPIWIMPSDTYDQAFTIPTAILVALCGGATILQPNTAEEGKRFGLIFPFGPIFWTLSPSHLKALQSDTPWKEREKRVLVAMSGDSRRKVLMKPVIDRFLEYGWIVQLTGPHILSRDEYVEMLKTSQVIVTTCWVQQDYIAGSRRTKNKISKTSLTHRVIEGFAVGAVVVTNSNGVLDLLGFEAGKHYVELRMENESIGNIVLPDDKELMKIAEAGHGLFSKLVVGDG